MMMIMMNCFYGMVDRRKAFSLISSRHHYQRSSQSQIFDTPRAGFEPAQSLSLGLFEWSCAVVITTTLHVSWKVRVNKFMTHLQDLGLLLWKWAHPELSAKSWTYMFQRFQCHFQNSYVSGHWLLWISEIRDYPFGTTQNFPKN